MIEIIWYKIHGKYYTQFANEFFPKKKNGNFLCIFVHLTWPILKGKSDINKTYFFWLEKSEQQFHFLLTTIEN